MHVRTGFLSIETHGEQQEVPVAEGLRRYGVVDGGLVRAAQVRRPVLLCCQVLCHLTPRHKHLFKQPPALIYTPSTQTEYVQVSQINLKAI